MAKQKTLILSLGGSLIVPKGEINVPFLKKFRTLILKLLKQGYKMVIITGGGGTNRRYNKGAKKIARVKNIDLDWLGISITKINAELVRTIFSKYAYPKVVVNPNTKIRTNKKLIIACGWKPGCSSDKDAVLWARNLKARTIVNLSDIDYAYDKDPDKYPDAKILKQVSWKDFLKIVGTKWSPRTSAPFGPPASKLAQKLKLRVIVLNGKKLKNLENCLKGKKFKGTVIS
ncbi:UMP kinase [Patescibacteria group bacterium]|nr:UMP kinase [Patescibacteria group bacterium]